MPIYEYKCPHCGTIREKQRPVALRDEPVACPACRRSEDEPNFMERVLSVPNVKVEGGTRGSS